MTFKPILPCLLMLSCSINRAPSDNLLDKRADYKHRHKIEAQLKSADSALISPQTTEAVVADIWVHPYELKNGDYFQGAWIKSIITRASWKFDKRPSLLTEPKPRHPKKP